MAAANGSHYRLTALQFSKTHSPAQIGVVEEILLRHGHAIVIGRVRTTLFHADGRLLVYWQGAYRDINQKISQIEENPVMSQVQSEQMTRAGSVPLTSIHRVEADGVNIFYRSAGDAKAPVLLLLHGFPSSSFMFRNLISRLADQYRVIAPDLAGFGFTQVPEGRKYKYTFEALAGTIDAFTEALGLKSYAIYVFDYGAPTGLRLAMRHPERVTAIVSQNGNAYEEGLGDAWGPIRTYWAQPTAENREVIRKNILNFEGTRWQYTFGVANPEVVVPESYTLDAALLERPGNKDIQLDLFLDYASNLKLYPKFQEYFRQSKPPLLAIWGKNDPFFIPAGAEAFRKDIPNAQVRFLDTGHFATETHFVEIAAAMKEFLEANGVVGRL
jgi:pimeloyl-ACP methyl ester carboxylesterase